MRSRTSNPPRRPPKLLKRPFKDWRHISFTHNGKTWTFLDFAPPRGDEYEAVHVFDGGQFARVGWPKPLARLRDTSPTFQGGGGAPVNVDIPYPFTQERDQ